MCQGGRASENCPGQREMSDGRHGAGAGMLSLSDSVPPGGVEPARLLCPWILSATILEWVAVSFSRESSCPRDQTCVSCASCIGGRFFTVEGGGEAGCMFVLMHREPEEESLHVEIPPPHTHTQVRLYLTSRNLESKVKVAQSCPTRCYPVGCTVHGILQARSLEWAAFPFSRGSSQLRVQTQVSNIASGFFTSRDTREAQEY